jgi:hypothetical protein
MRVGATLWAVGFAFEAVGGLAARALQDRSRQHGSRDDERTLALPGEIAEWSLTSLREKVVKIGAKVIAHGRYVIFQMAEVAVPCELFGRTLDCIARLRPPAVARC